MIYTVLSATIVFTLYAANLNATNLQGKHNEEDTFPIVNEEELHNQYEGTTPAPDIETRGFFLIINIRNVRNADARLGSHADIANLWNTFASLGYEPKIVDDRDEPLTHDQVIEAVREFAQDPRQEHYRATVVALMSHGDDNDMLITSDGSGVGLNEVKDVLDLSRYLEGKTKMLIVQSCRGGGRDIMATPIDTDSKGDSKDCQGDSCIRRLRAWWPWGQHHQQQPQPATAPVWKLKPFGSDFVIIRSTQPGKVSYRDIYLGSYLVITLCATLRRGGRSIDLLTMLYHVTDRMNKRMVYEEIYDSSGTPTENHWRRELCETTTTLDNPFYL